MLWRVHYACMPCGLRLSPLHEACDARRWVAFALSQSFDRIFHKFMHDRV